MSLEALEHVVDHLLPGQTHQVIAARTGLGEHLEPVIDVGLARHAAAEHRHRRLDDGDVVLEGAKTVHRHAQQRFLDAALAGQGFARDLVALVAELGGNVAERRAHGMVEELGSLPQRRERVQLFEALLP
ncbi:Uncharacterised protein [Bordetella pertussis]|nr:Uncharacterised protein [Bordetella pertussis]CPJ72049.1 Uncharacterised protein [Bordetella pertussis]